MFLTESSNETCMPRLFLVSYFVSASLYTSAKFILKTAVWPSCVFLREGRKGHLWRGQEQDSLKNSEICTGDESHNRRRNTPGRAEFSRELSLWRTGYSSSPSSLSHRQCPRAQSSTVAMGSPSANLKSRSYMILRSKLTGVPLSS